MRNKKFLAMILVGTMLFTVGCQGKKENEAVTDKNSEEVSTTISENEAEDTTDASDDASISTNSDDAESKNVGADEDDKEENQKYTLCEGYPSKELLTENKWYYTGWGETYEMILNENGEFSSDYFLEERDWSMGNFSNYSYDEETGVITLGKEDDNAASAEYKILYYTDNSLFVKNEDDSIEQFISEKSLSDMPELEFIHSNMFSGYNAFVTILEQEGDKMFVGSIDYASAAESNVMEFTKPEEFCYLLEVENGINEEEAVGSFKYVELTEKGVEELLQKGPCKAYITIWGDSEIGSIVFYAETEVEENIDYAKLFEKKESNGTKKSIIGTTWHMDGGNDELTFTQDGEFYYGYDGEPRGMSDCYPYYEYDEEKGIITVFDESKQDTSTIKIVEHTAEKLVLEMEEPLVEGEYTFVTAEEQVQSPFLVVNENDYLSLEGLVAIEEISEDSIMVKATTGEFDYVSGERELSDATTYFIMEEVEGEIKREGGNKYRYIQLTNKGAQKLIEESVCSAFIAVDDDGTKIKKVVFYPAGAIIEESEDEEKNENSQESLDNSSYPTLEEIAGTQWVRKTDSCIETICFREENGFGYYCACGEPVGSADVFEEYSYDEETGIFTIYEYGDGPEIYISIVEYNENSLVLDMPNDLEEGQKTFELEK